ncbi:MAG: hypothetical protein AAFR35_07000 [Pseudomonadota bacterium]
MGIIGDLRTLGVCLGLGLAVLFPFGTAAQVGDVGRLFCVGTGPGFLMTIEEDAVAFDYLGDGSYGLDPPLSSRDFNFARHNLVTAQETWPVFIEHRQCTALDATLPVSIEIAVPTSAGDAPLQGCCVWNPKE